MRCLSSLVSVASSHDYRTPRQVLGVFKCLKVIGRVQCAYQESKDWAATGQLADERHDNDRGEQQVDALKEALLSVGDLWQRDAAQQRQHCRLCLMGAHHKLSCL